MFHTSGETIKHKISLVLRGLGTFLPIFSSSLRNVKKLVPVLWARGLMFPFDEVGSGIQVLYILRYQSGHVTTMEGAGMPRINIPGIAESQVTIAPQLLF